MESISPVALDKVASAWADAVAAAEAEANKQATAAAVEPHAPGAGVQAQTTDAFVERILGQAASDAAAVPARPAGIHADSGPETGSVQTAASSPASVPERSEADPQLPFAAARSEFALPSALLVPATLIGLQVEPAASWPLWRQAAEPVRRRDDDARSEDELPNEERETESEAPREEPDGDAEREVARAEVDEPPAEDWCEALTRALQAALSARIPPQALLIAADQWARGRCVVLACPQGPDPAGPAWAFVLWPRRSAQPAHGAPRERTLALSGLRVEARLQWSSPPRDAHWCHVRVVKEHHPKRGRQLVSVAATDKAANAPVACEVQLGPVLARSLRWCEVCVHVHAAKRFWAALGAQWSAYVVVCSRPLAIPRAAQEESAC